MNGWVKTYRALKNWEWYTDSQMVHLWIHLILSANHEAGKWRGIDIGRGQLVTGRKALSFETGISEQGIRTCLSRLEQTGEITQKSTNKYTIVTVCKYDDYQSFDELANQQPTNNQPATNQQPTTNNKNKKNKKEKKEKNSLNWIADSDWRKIFNEWLEYRKEIGKPIKSEKSERAGFTNLQQLSNFDKNIARAIINQSIANGYQGLFSLKNNTNGNHKQPIDIDPRRLEGLSAGEQIRLYADEVQKNIR